MLLFYIVVMSCRDSPPVQWMFPDQEPGDISLSAWFTVLSEAKQQVTSFIFTQILSSTTILIVTLINLAYINYKH